MTITAPAPADTLDETLQLIRRLRRAVAARERLATKVTHATVRATLAATDQGRSDWQEIATEARAIRTEWDEEIRRLQDALTRF